MDIGKLARHRTPARRPGHYNYFPDYDPGIGRYIESDPVGLQGGLNTYGYVYSRPLSLVDRDGLVAGPAGEPELGYRWKPQSGDKYPDPAPDGGCMVMCIVLKTALGTGLGEGARAAGNFMQGSGSTGVRMLGGMGSFAANLIGRTPAGQLLGAGITMTGCEALCRKPSRCEVPQWAQPYQHMPLPPLSSAFPR